MLNFAICIRVTNIFLIRLHKNMFYYNCLSAVLLLFIL